MKEFYTIKEIMEQLQISRNTAYKVIQDETFPKITVGSQIRIPKDEFEDWVKHSSLHSKKEEKMYFTCLRCKSKYAFDKTVYEKISYVQYSYCENCLRKGIELLLEDDKMRE